MSKQIIEIQYFGCISYYIEAIRSKHLFLEQFETYQKMSFRNRCQVLGAGKVLDLTVPLLGGRDQKAFITDIRIDNAQAWQKQHWVTLESCYNKSPFFLYYKESLRSLLFAPYETLWELNAATIKWVIAKLKAGIKVESTSSFAKNVSLEFVDLRGRFVPSNRKSTLLTPYQQVFEKPFESNLCILDLLFNLGPGSHAYLARQAFI